MSFSRQLDFRIEGITVTAPLRHRVLDGVIADLWSADGKKGARGYYRSSHPRFVLFLGDLAGGIQMTNEATTGGAKARPMTRITYVPAGMPLWSEFTSARQIQHLDLYLHQQVIQKMLADRLGAPAALAALRRPVELDQSADIDTLGQLVAQEVALPKGHDLYAESLIQAIVCGVLDLSPTTKPEGLNNAQMRRLERHLQANIHRRIANGEWAELLGFSESWFAHIFKQTTGQTPQQWQTERRVAQARICLMQSGQSLGDLAVMLGFADQAHLTRVFRSATGQTPGVWRRQHRFGE
ncbi:helix-turn-helix domain-containing protein [Neogemmobacter tilapiae]|uniref:Transcriptional regulator n=1 Tax=Neogemmobacter tilapiae TaxID=875041 RepID=A0A918WNU9_9RHOB|nr:AraC family transcriptional regulator [Gemmobacter tilapiae]GHC60268.1 transcriptional regulator [Gemmobacter tilapiae]